MPSYWISICRGEATTKGTIHDPKSKLKISAIDLLNSRFRPQKGEVSYFVTSGDEAYAFQTSGYNKHRKLLILHMIAWYCTYLGLFEAQIHSSLPI